MTASCGTTPPDGCDAPESRPDGCVGVRPGEEPAEWSRITLGVVPTTPAHDPGDRARVEEQLRQLSEAGAILVMLRGSPRVLTPQDVAPEHCPICIEASRLRPTWSVEPCPVHVEAEEEA